MKAGLGLIRIVYNNKIKRKGSRIRAIKTTASFKVRLNVRVQIRGRDQTLIWEWKVRGALVEGRGRGRGHTSAAEDVDELTEERKNTLLELPLLPLGLRRLLLPHRELLPNVLQQQLEVTLPLLIIPPQSLHLLLLQLPHHLQHVSIPLPLPCT